LRQCAATPLKDELYRRKENAMRQPELPRQTCVPIKFKNSIKPNTTFKSAKERFKSIYFETIAKVIDEISNRFQDEMLAPLILIENILKGTHEENNVNELSDLSFYMIQFEQLKIEILSWKQLPKIRKTDKKYDLSTISDITRLIRDENLSKDYPNLERLLRIYLTIPITSVSAERSFSALKRIKTYLRNTMDKSVLLF
jgi:hypothetical protein